MAQTTGAHQQMAQNLYYMPHLKLKAIESLQALIGSLELYPDTPPVL